jgi:hypothetical protein
MTAFENIKVDFLVKCAKCGHEFHDARANGEWIQDPSSFSPLGFVWGNVVYIHPCPVCLKNAVDSN